MIFCEEFFKTAHHLFNLADLSTKIKNSDGLNLSEVMMMKRKKFYSNLDVCINFNNVAKKKLKNTAIAKKPLAVAVCAVLSGLSLPAYAAAGFTSPATVSTTVTLPAVYNPIASTSLNTPASLTITETGTINFPDSTAWLHGARIVSTGANDNNTITSYGTINGSTSYSGYVIGGFFYITGTIGVESIQTNGNTVSFKAGSSTNNVGVYGGYAYDSVSGDSATASGNTVLVEYGSDFTSPYVAGGFASANGVAVASNNTVILGAGSYTSMVYGGYACSTYISISI